MAKGKALKNAIKKQRKELKTKIDGGFVKATLKLLKKWRKQAGKAKSDLDLFVINAMHIVEITKVVARIRIQDQIAASQKRIEAGGITGRSVPRFHPDQKIILNKRTQKK